MKAQWISQEQIFRIVTAIIVTLTRVFTVKEDFRQYPSYPASYMIHLVTGVIAAALGAVAIPALMTKNFRDVTMTVQTACWAYLICNASPYQLHTFD